VKDRRDSGRRQRRAISGCGTVRYATIDAAGSPGSLIGYQDGKRDFVERLKSAARDWSEMRDAS
jgi:hypothetical protein